MHKSPLLAGTQAPRVPGFGQAIAGQTIPGVQPAAVHWSWIVSSAVVSLTHIWQPQDSAELTGCVHCATPALTSHRRAPTMAAT